jgi:hypothetical protein
MPASRFPTLRALALFALVPAFLPLAACGGGPPPAPGSTRPTEGGAGDQASALHFGFRLPEALPGVAYERVMARHLLAHSLGYALRYADGEDSTWDLFIYPMAPDGDALPPETLPERLAREFENAARDVHILAEQREWRVEARSAPTDGVREGPSGEVRFRQQSFRYDAESDEPRDTRVVVGAVGRAFVKLRTTYPASQTSLREPADSAFVDAVFRAFEPGGGPGMAGYNREEARRGPLPDSIPETFGWLFPPRLPLGFLLAGQDRLPNRDDGIVAIYRVQGYGNPLQVFLRPVYDEGDAAEPIDPARVEATWQTNREGWASSIREGLGGQGFHPLTEAPEAAPPEEVWTRYGPQSLRRLSWNFENDEGQRIVARLASARVENLLLVSGHVGPPPLAAEVHEEFVLELLSNLLVRRPPPGHASP